MNNFVSFSSKPLILGKLDCDAHFPDLFVDTHRTHDAIPDYDKDPTYILDPWSQDGQVSVDQRPAASESETHNGLIDHLQGKVSLIHEGLQRH